MKTVLMVVLLVVAGLCVAGVGLAAHDWAVRNMAVETSELCPKEVTDEPKDSGGPTHFRESDGAPAC